MIKKAWALSIGLHALALGLVLWGAAAFPGAPGLKPLDQALPWVEVFLPEPPATAPQAPHHPVVPLNSETPRESGIPTPALGGTPGSKDTSAGNPEASLIPPRLPENFAPEYPHLARRLGWEGRCAYIVAVDPQGLVTQADLDQSSGRSLLDHSARTQLLATRFIPATQNGQSISSRQRIVLVYSLSDSKGEN